MFSLYSSRPRIKLYTYTTSPIYACSGKLVIILAEPMQSLTNALAILSSAFILCCVSWKRIPQLTCFCLHLQRYAYECLLIAALPVLAYLLAQWSRGIGICFIYGFQRAVGPAIAVKAVHERQQYSC